MSVTASTTPRLQPLSAVSDPPSPADGRREQPLRSRLGIITLGWVFGAVWQMMITGSPVTQFMKGLGASNFQFGLFAALPFIASLLSVPASLHIERTGRRKPLFMWSLYPQRLLWFPIALVPMWMHAHGSPAGRPIAVFLWLTLLMYATGAVGGPAWVSWMADVVPGRLRSRYFARRRQLAIPLAMAAALLVGWMLDHQSDPALTMRWCAILFMSAAVFGVVDIAMFLPVPDPPRAPKEGSGLLRAMGTPLKDRQFLVFGGFVATLTFAVSFMSQFATLYLAERVYVGSRAASFGTGAQLMLVVMPMAAQLLVLPAWGAAADRVGKKPILVIAALGMVPIGLGWCFVSPTSVWLGYLLSFAGACLWTGVEVANFNTVIEMSGRGGEQGGSAYVAVNTVIVNIAGCLGGLTAGVIAQVLQDMQWTPSWGFKTFTFYDVLFVLSGVFRLAAVVLFLPFLHEATAGSALDMARFVTRCLFSPLARRGRPSEPSSPGRPEPRIRVSARATATAERRQAA